MEEASEMSRDDSAAAYIGAPIVSAIRSIVGSRAQESKTETADLVASVGEKNSTKRFAAVRISDVWIPRPSRPRSNVDEDSLEALAKSIKAIGLIEPIVVVEEVEDHCTDCQKIGNAVCGPTHRRRIFRLVAGERRLLACNRLGLVDIETAVFSSMDSERRDDVALHENVQRTQLTIWDFYREVLARRARNPNESIARLSERTDLSESFITDCEAISEMVSPELVIILRTDARAIVFRNLAMAAQIEGTTERERHAAQKAWWAAEGWNTRPVPKRRGGKRGPRVRMSSRDVERLARRIEDDRIVQVGDERAELGARQARIVAALLRATLLPPTRPAVANGQPAELGS